MSTLLQQSVLNALNLQFKKKEPENNEDTTEIENKEKAKSPYPYTVVTGSTKLTDKTKSIHWCVDENHTTVNFTDFESFRRVSVFEMVTAVFNHLAEASTDNTLSPKSIQFLEFNLEKTFLMLDIPVVIDEDEVIGTIASETSFWFDTRKITDFFHSFPNYEYNVYKDNSMYPKLGMYMRSCIYDKKNPKLVAIEDNHVADLEVGEELYYKIIGMAEKLIVNAGRKLSDDPRDLLIKGAVIEHITKDYTVFKVEGKKEVMNEVIGSACFNSLEDQVYLSLKNLIQNDKKFLNIVDELCC